MFLPEDDSGDRPYTVYGEAPTPQCDECGDEIDKPGLCIWCFAISTTGGSFQTGNIDTDKGEREPANME